LNVVLGQSRTVFARERTN